MSDDVISGYDGKPRCAWAGAGDASLGRYHDEVWGTRTDDESALFERARDDVRVAEPCRARKVLREHP
jgi:hypothetical protein